MSERDGVPVDAAELRARVDALRSARGWTWKDVASKAGLTEKTLERWKRGKNTPSRDSVERIAEVFGTTLDALIEGLMRRPIVSSAPPSSDNLIEFDARTPAVGPSFVGRATELETLADAFGRGHSTNVVGDPHIGKSSLLKEWARRAQQKGHEVTFVAGLTIASNSPASLVEAITGLPCSADPNGAADALIQWIKARPRRARPLIVIDDFDELSRRLPHAFFDRLRGIAGTNLACFVLATRRHISELRPSEDESAATSTASLVTLFWPLALGLLDADAAETLILRAEGWTCLDGPELLRRWAGRHPFFIHLLGQHLTRAQRRNAPPDAAVEEFFAEAQRFLERLWRRLGPSEQGFLLEEEISFPSRPAGRLYRRGLLTEERAHFGGVLTRWLSEMTR